ncbi:hypothetical protein, partial [Arsenicibacter rosenii]|uniref:hypothetical protein n=1 Tax=Arsenicibacter rosenii TaxID=1750698 RepID=UPI0011607EE4
MAKRINPEQIGMGLAALLISWIVWLLVTHIMDCAQGSDRYSEVLVVDKEFREAWVETRTEIEVYQSGKITLTRPVIREHYHAARYTLH